MRLLRDVTEGGHAAEPCQVILTTHSPYLLDHVDMAPRLSADTANCYGRWCRCAVGGESGCRAWRVGIEGAELLLLWTVARRHREEVLEADRRIRARSATRKNPPEVEEILHRGREQIRARLAEIQEQKAKGRHVEVH